MAPASVYVSGEWWLQPPAGRLSIIWSSYFWTSGPAVWGRPEGADRTEEEQRAGTTSWGFGILRLDYSLICRG